MSDLMGDVAQGIKAFKKGMSEDDTTAQAKPEPDQDHRGRRRCAEAGSRPRRERRS